MLWHDAAQAWSRASKSAQAGSRGKAGAKPPAPDRMSDRVAYCGGAAGAGAGAGAAGGGVSVLAGAGASAARPITQSYQPAWPNLQPCR